MLIDITRTPDNIRLQTVTGFISGKFNESALYCHDGIEIELIENKDKIDISFRADIPVQRVIFRWNQKLSNISVLNDAFERAYGNLMWRNLVPEMALPWYFMVEDKSSLVSQGIGVMTGANALCFWQADSDGITLMLDIRNGGRAVELKDRGKIILATIVSLNAKNSQSSYNLYRDFCRAMCERPLIPDFPVYGGNNWYYSYGNSSHNDIVTDAKLMSDLSPNQENRPFMVIDSGWQQSDNRYTCPGGPYNRGNYLFPDMSGLAKEMNSIGVRPGLWMRPLLTSEKVHDEMVLLYKRATQQPFEGDVLDPTHPDCMDIIKADINRAVSWGYELIKHDFSTHDIFSSMWSPIKSTVTEHDGWGFFDKTMTSAEVFKLIYSSILQATENKALIIGCNTITHLNAGLAHIQRTGDDTSGRVWDRTRKMGVNALAFRMPQHKAFYLCDADCVGITKDVDWKLNERWLKLLSLSGTPLFISAAPDCIGNKEKEAIREAFSLAATDITPGIPLDWKDTATPTKWLLSGNEHYFDWSDISGNILLDPEV